MIEVAEHTSVVVPALNESLAIRQLVTALRRDESAISLATVLPACCAESAPLITMEAVRPMLSARSFDMPPNWSPPEMIVCFAVG